MPLFFVLGHENGHHKLGIELLVATRQNITNVQDGSTERAAETLERLFLVGRDHTAIANNLADQEHLVAQLMLKKKFFFFGDNV